MTFEEHLKTLGFNDADLSDPTMKGVIEKFRPGYEQILADNQRVTNEYQTYKQEVEERWTPSVNQRIAEAEQQAIAARRLAADLQEQVKIARDYGFIDEKSTPPGMPPAAPAKPALEAGMQFDPKAHGLITQDDVARYADAQGDAMAQLEDLAQEYAALTGKQIFEYQGPNGQSGLRALRQEAKQQRKLVTDYVAEKFKFNDLRQQKRDAAQKAREDAIRREEAEKVRMEMAQQYGNPNLRTPVPSKVSLVPKPSDGKQPWMQTADQRKAARLERAMTKVLTQGTVQ